jgi:L-ascorbate metabolism protein UlaG (beta-lactamase superfamily)
MICNKTFLVDPIFFDSTPMYKHFTYTNYPDFSQFPQIDFLLITHNHHDHLSIKSIALLKDKIQKIIVPLGVSSYLTGLFE